MFFLSITRGQPISGLIFLEERGKSNTLLGGVKQGKLPTLQKIIFSQTVQEELQKRKVVDNLSQIRKDRCASRGKIENGYG
jgi:hypothetical protein